MTDVAGPELFTVLRTFHPNLVRYPYGRRDLRRWFHPMGRSAREDEYSLTGFVRTQSLFIHIPKAAGTSVTQSLYGNLAGGHRTIGEYQRVIWSGALKRMFTYTFVRNPWDRVFSAYNFLKAGGWPGADEGYAKQFLGNCASFEQFVIEVLPREDAREKVHFHPMARSLKGLDGNWFPFDFVGRFERFSDDFEYVRQRVNPHATASHRNLTPASKNRDYRNSYTPAMVDIVAKIYSEDIAALGYSFEGYTENYPANPA